MKSNKLGVFLSRMQPMHEGHIKMINNIMDEHECTLVLIGSADKSMSKRNPMPINFRTKIAKKYFMKQLKSFELVIKELDDMTDEDDKDVKSWGKYLVDNIENKLLGKNFRKSLSNGIVFHTSEDEAMINPWFEDIPNVEIVYHKRDDGISSTIIRKEIIEMNKSGILNILPETMTVQELIELHKNVSEDN